MKTCRRATIVIILILSVLPAPGAAVTLDRKLDANFRRYDTAKDLLLKNFQSGVMTDRETLEGMLDPGEPFRMNTNDLLLLRERHRSIIETARRLNRQKSLFDFERLKEDPETLDQFLMELPKGGMLHNHPGGVRNMKTVREILDRVDPVIHVQEDILDKTDKYFSYLYEGEKDRLRQFPPVSRFSDYREYQKNYLVNLCAVPQDGKPHPFPRFTGVYQVSKVLRKTSDNELRKWVEAKTYEDFIQRAARHNVSYVELTKGFDYERDIAQLEWWAKKWEKEYGVTARWNRSFLRIMDNPSNMRSFEAFAAGVRKRPGTVVRGIDLIANETEDPALDKGQSLFLAAYEKET